MDSILALLTFQPFPWYGSKEAELAQEIREISFEHLLLYTISVAYASATALGVHSPAKSKLSYDVEIVRLEVEKGKIAYFTIGRIVRG